MNAIKRVAILFHFYSLDMGEWFFDAIDKIIKNNPDQRFTLLINIPDFRKQADIDKALQPITELNLEYHKVIRTSNKGGDIGAALQLMHLATTTDQFDWYIIMHTKTKLRWRQELFRPLFVHNFLNRFNPDQNGIYGSKKWCLEMIPDTDNFNRFAFHFNRLQEIYNISFNKKWQFIGGTVFAVNPKIIHFIAKSALKTYNILNDAYSVDQNWVYLIDNVFKKDRKGTGNDFTYRLKYKKSLMSDYMIEHAFERFYGAVAAHLNLDVTWPIGLS